VADGGLPAGCDGGPKQVAPARVPRRRLARLAHASPLIVCAPSSRAWQSTVARGRRVDHSPLELSRQVKCHSLEEEAYS
jgi:hypothetical protein